jgi:hypothetical protein
VFLLLVFVCAITLTRHCYYKSVIATNSLENRGWSVQAAQWVGCSNLCDVMENTVLSYIIKKNNSNYKVKSEIVTSE